jgi:hypothetical protein
MVIGYTIYGFLRLQNLTAPVAMGSSRVKQRARVDFPEPEGPATARTSPSGSSKLISSKAGTLTRPPGIRHSALPYDQLQ